MVWNRTSNLAINNKIKGGVKEAVGDATDNKKTEIGGKIEKKSGEIQRKMGDAKEHIEDAAKNH